MQNVYYLQKLKEEFSRRKRATFCLLLESVRKRFGNSSFDTQPGALRKTSAAANQEYEARGRKAQELRSIERTLFVDGCRKAEYDPR